MSSLNNGIGAWKETAQSVQWCFSYAWSQTTSWCTLPQHGVWIGRSQNRIFDRFLETGGYDRPRFFPLNPGAFWGFQLPFSFIWRFDSLVFGAGHGILVVPHCSLGATLRGLSRSGELWVFQTKGINSFCCFNLVCVACACTRISIYDMTLHDTTWSYMIWYDLVWFCMIYTSIHPQLLLVPPGHCAFGAQHQTRWVHLLQWWWTFGWCCLWLWRLSTWESTIVFGAMF